MATMDGKDEIEDDDFAYEEVDVDDEEEEQLDEDFNTALKTSKLKAPSLSDIPTPQVAKRPEVVDDFIRNFLHRAGLVRTLDCFQSEFYELQSQQKIPADALIAVPDAYLHIQQLEEDNSRLRGECEKLKSLAAKARGMWDKLRRERDHHRMHHRRVVQEKDKLINDIRRLKTHIDGYEPTLKELQRKYELAMKEKMLMRLERDKLVSKVEGLEQTLQTVDAGRGIETAKSAATTASTMKKRAVTAARDAVLPAEDRDNPFWGLDFAPTPVESFNMAKTFKGHSAPIAAVAMHPKKPLVATCSDDATWKLWSIPAGDLLMAGEGHREWVSDIDFHPSGTHVATSSGDGTVKIWDFASASCCATFTDHSQAVWSVAYHDCGEFVVSASMDRTARLWDVNTGKCKQSFRGHVDSVNSVVWQPFTNMLCTGSGDKTLSLWDARTALCVQSFYGHENSCNSAVFNNRADLIASTDADGVVKVWDVRMVRELWTARNPQGVHPANKASFDRSGKVLVVASNDGTLECYNVDDGSLMTKLSGHEDSVSCVVFDPSGKIMVTAGNDCTFRLWQ